MVDFDKLLLESMGEEKYAQLQSAKRYLLAEKRRYAEMSDDDLIVTALHNWHNSECTTYPGNVNGCKQYDCVYDSALVFRTMPRLIIRLMHASQRFAKDADALESGKEVKCPMEGCTGYVELP